MISRVNDWSDMGQLNCSFARVEIDRIYIMLLNYIIKDLFKWIFDILSQTRWNLISNENIYFEFIEPTWIIEIEVIGKFY